MHQLTGQCLCGDVRFVATEVDSGFSACHCRMCQRWSGGPFMAVTARKVTFEGEDHLVRFRSSKWAERGFCRRCGSNLFFRLLRSGEYEMCLGAFDDPEGIRMTGEIFIDRKPAAYALAGEHPRLTEAETIARYRQDNQ